MSNKFWDIFFTFIFILFLVLLFVITLDMLHLISISKIFVYVAIYIICAMAGTFLATTSLLKQRLSECKTELNREQDFNNSYIDSLYKENETLKETVGNLAEENETLLVLLLNPSGKKMN